MVILLKIKYLSQQIKMIQKDNFKNKSIQLLTNLQIKSNHFNKLTILKSNKYLKVLLKFNLQQDEKHLIL
jgi:hypothetical protein